MQCLCSPRNWAHWTINQGDGKPRLNLGEEQATQRAFEPLEDGSGKADESWCSQRDVANREPSRNDRSPQMSF